MNSFFDPPTKKDYFKVSKSFFMLFIAIILVNYIFNGKGDYISFGIPLLITSYICCIIFLGICNFTSLKEVKSK